MWCIRIYLYPQLHPTSIISWNISTQLPLPLRRKPNPKQQRRLFDVVMLIAQHTHAAGLHHQTQREGKLVAEPSLRERPGQVPVSDEDDVLGSAAVFHPRCLQVPDLGDEGVHAGCYLGGGPGVRG